MTNIFFTFPGNANDRWNFGGAPIDLKDEFVHEGYSASCLNLSPTPLHQLRRYAWNAKEALTFRGIGGYQYSSTYLNDIWRNELVRTSSGVMINMFQMFHPIQFRFPELKKVFYIDQTLIQLFDNYWQTKHISPYHRRAAIALEKTQYEKADLVACMCQWAADSVIQDYGIDRSRVSVAEPGGSINFRSLPFMTGAEDTRPDETVHEFNKYRPLRFVFVGIDPIRKGLYRFLDALKTLPELHDTIRVTVIGPRTECPETYRSISNLDWLGRIGHDVFTDTVRNNDVGMLLSTGEATGRSLREFQMLGLAVLAPNVGGSPEMVAPGAGILVEPDAGADEIAAIIRDLHRFPDRISQMRDAAWKARHDMTWNATAKTLIAQLKTRGIV